MVLAGRILERKLRGFLEDDVGQGDITTMLTIPQGVTVEAEIVAKEEGIIAGIQETMVFLESQGLQVEAKIADGEAVKPKTIVLRLVGDARIMLTLERTVLNILARMSGIATVTNRIVGKVRKAGYKTRIASTRKVAPGLLYFDKKAVMIGGGDVHRMRLDDMVLIKDNHLAIVGDVAQAIEKAQQKVSFSKKIEVEVTSLEDAVKAARAKADIIMLDNFSLNQINETLDALKKNRLRDRILVEASGGIDEENVVRFATTGVDVLSLGEITQSAKALDLSLEVVKVRKSKSEK